MKCDIIIPSARAMMNFGKKLARALLAEKLYQAIIYLQGNLGAGKTTLVRGLLQGFGFAGKVKSPTFTIVEPYQITDRIIYHFDLYRLMSAEELALIGARDYFSARALCVIEWPEHGGDFVPSPSLVFSLQFDERNPKRRILKFAALDAVGEMVVKSLKK